MTGTQSGNLGHQSLDINRSVIRMDSRLENGSGEELGGGLSWREAVSAQNVQVLHTHLSTHTHTLFSHLYVDSEGECFFATALHNRSFNG